MSYDLGVWYPREQLDWEEATEVYTRLCDGDTSGVVAHPAVDLFYAELTAKHPELAEVPAGKEGDHDDSPWSEKMDRSAGHVILSCAWPKASYVHELVKELARKHGLAVYDPQGEQVIYPDVAVGIESRGSGTSFFVLGAFALLFGGMFVYSARISVATTSMVLYVFAGLCALMAAGCFWQVWRR
jgi:hypothetical protein